MENYSSNNIATPKVCIILVNYLGWQDTIECMQSLLNLTYTNWQAIIVDNNSPNNSYNQLKDWANTSLSSESSSFLTEDELQLKEESYESKFLFIKANKNQGFAAGNNIALKYLLQLREFEYIWLLNNDTTVAPDSLSAYISSASKKSNVGIWGAKLLYYHKPDIIQAIGGSFNKKLFTTKHIGENLSDAKVSEFQFEEIDYVVGASMLVSKKFVEHVGLMDENYFLYFEELDWATRASKHGYKLSYVDSCRIYHKEGQSIGSNSNGNEKSDLADYHGIKSKIYFIRKHYPEYKLRLYILVLTSVILRLARLKFKRAAVIFKLLYQTV
ncbi:glycosyltransferase family 2 protein [Pontibacter cellulosilyticus]|uniref:Glycosyltransferase family 2 protein n=1 Tax=Pontibacter cellulosilyticus TaxID=1720253 RepID=A0A923SHU4_9BACT|nr:glycosyltransferase family 2 protein [Pontibacter cellulosilyticus]MBC5992109.1 glycosyltransferase family 2 protein [Pontibacter cellulosilyticus]